MLRRRIVTVLVAIAVLLCVPVYSVSAEEEDCEISVVIVGKGEVTVNGISFDEEGEFDEDFPVGEQVTMTAAAKDKFDFLFWYNTETKHIVSWEETFTFYAATYAMYTAVFDLKEEIAVQRGVHTVIYLTGSENWRLMRTVPLNDTSFFSDVGTTGMFVSGKKFVDWDHSLEEVGASSGRMVVRPRYSTNAKFTVTAIVAGTTTTYPEQQYRSLMTLVAPQRLNTGATFSYWIAHPKDVNDNNHEIASFYSQYQFYVTGDVTLEAVYGEPLNDIPVACRIAGDFPSFQESAISVFAEHSVAGGFTVLQHGMLLTYNQRIGNFADEFVINPDEPSITKLTAANDYSLAGLYSASSSKWYVEHSEDGYDYFPRLFARAYIIVQDASGVTYTRYSAPYCVDYIFDTGSSGGDNYDDPTFD